MVELDQFKYTLSTYEAPLKEVRDSLNLDAKIRRIDELDKTMEEPSFWEDAERSTRLVKEAKNLKDTVGEFNKLQNQYEEIGLLIQIADEENDASVIPEIQKMVNEFAAELESLRLRTLLTGEYDSNLSEHSHFLVNRPFFSILKTRLCFSSDLNGLIV